MMVIVRSGGEAPSLPGVAVKAHRQTPEMVSGAAGQTDYFCVAAAEGITALRDAGWQVVELRDGWYAGDQGGGVGISGHGRYWEIRDTLFTVKEAAGAADATPEADRAGVELVNVRGAIFGV